MPWLFSRWAAAQSSASQGKDSYEAIADQQAATLRIVGFCTGDVKTILGIGEQSSEPSDIVNKTYTPELDAKLPEKF
jgi:hypothetical protein